MANMFTDKFILELNTLYSLHGKLNTLYSLYVMAEERKYVDLKSGQLCFPKATL
jgi:hypothetical protein